MSDDYIENTIKKGDLFSKKLSQLTTETIGNNEFVELKKEGMHGIALARPPKDVYVVAISGTGNPEANDIQTHAHSLVDNMSEKLRSVGAIPVGYTNIIDAYKLEEDLAEKIEEALVDASKKNNVVAMNGESADLGNLMNVNASLSGTIIGFISPEKLETNYKKMRDSGMIFFHPENRLIFMNSDGEGTKSQLQAMLKKPWLGVRDAGAMVLDDSGKMFLDVYALMMVVDFNGSNYKKEQKFLNEFDNVLKENNIHYKGKMIFEDSKGRFTKFEDIEDEFNINATAISLVGENHFDNLPVPQAGQFLYMIKTSRENLRSNGITDIRKAAPILLGEKYWLTKEGQEYLKFMAEPSEIYYKFFIEALQNGTASAVYHLSGGAFNGKLAKPLASHGLFVDMEHRLSKPTDKQIALLNAIGTKTEHAYGKLPLNNDAFVATENPQYLETLAQRYDYEYRRVGTLQKAQGDNIGVKFIAYDGTPVHFKGIDNK